MVGAVCICRWNIHVFFQRQCLRTLSLLLGPAVFSLFSLQSPLFNSRKLKSRGTTHAARRVWPVLRDSKRKIHLRSRSIVPAGVWTSRRQFLKSSRFLRDRRRDWPLRMTSHNLINSPLLHSKLSYNFEFHCVYANGYCDGPIWRRVHVLRSVLKIAYTNASRLWDFNSRISGNLVEK